jgi:hypothetical protein
MIISAALSYEWLILNDIMDGTNLFSYFPSLKNINQSTEAGRPISLWLGYIGIGLMCMMNIYSFRKKFRFMKRFGNKERYLDFHIFCGLMGSVFIIFHTNFIIGGLVAISFWSMVISASSGIIGKFFYSQILFKRSSLIKQAEKIDKKLERLYEKINKKNSAKGEDPVDQGELKARFLNTVGVNTLEHLRHDASVFASLINTLVVPFRFAVSKHSLRSATFHEIEFNLLRQSAFTHRKIYLLNANKKIMGHWSTFHKPFAIFMYFVAIIHIASALLFQVKH